MKRPRQPWERRDETPSAGLCHRLSGVWDCWRHVDVFGRVVDTCIYQPLRFTFLIWVMVIVRRSGNNWGAVLGGFIIWFLWIEVEPLGYGLWSGSPAVLKGVRLKRSSHGFPALCVL